MRRAVAMAVLLLMPTGVLAADSLGPQSTPAQPSASPETSGILQPANGSSTPLQSNQSSTGGVAQPSSTQDLQQTGTADQAKLFIQGDVDTTETPEEGHNLALLWDFLLVLVATGSGTAAVLLLQRRQAQQSSKK